MFAKFSSPSARILFSEVAIIRNYQGVPHLMFRLVNERENRIVNAKVKATILKVETINDETSMRRFHDIELVRSETVSYTHLDVYKRQLLFCLGF